MKFSIGTFNVENLISADIPIYSDARPRYNKIQYTEKINWVKHQLLKMDADIVGFQEVFDENSLRDCIAGTPFEHWNLFVVDSQAKKPANAILSKFPIVSTQVIDQMPFTFDFFDEKEKVAKEDRVSIQIPIKSFSRSVLKAELAIAPDIHLIVFVAHLKSKRPTLPEGMDRDTASYAELGKASIRSLIRRGIECAGIRQILSEQIEKEVAKPIVFLGDLNDADTSVTSQVILGPAPFFKLPMEQKIQRWKHVFQNCKDVQERKSIGNFYFTYIHNGHHESLDNIFVSNHFSGLNEKKIGSIIDVRLYNDHVIDNTISQDRKPHNVSDHGQAVVNIKIFTDPIDQLNR